MRNLVPITAVAAALLMPLAGFAAPRTGAEGAGAGRLTQMCTEGSRDIAGLPVDQFQRTVQADDAQRAALDDLANATTKAAQDIKAACPAETPLTAPGRLAATQMRIEAMIAAVAAVRPPLEKFYGLLSDEQKEKIVALGRNQRQGRSGSLLDKDCGAAQGSVTAWPTADIERTVRPTEAQRASLVTLQDAAAKAADMYKGSCPAEDLLTPTARIAAVGQRLDTLLQAVKTVSAPLNDFYGTLDDEQKAKLTRSAANEPGEPPAADELHRRHFVSIEYPIRRLFAGFKMGGAPGDERFAPQKKSRSRGDENIPMLTNPAENVIRRIARC